MAATVLGRDAFTVEDLSREVIASWSGDDTNADIGLVESAGGAWSPQASDAKHVGDFANALGADGVLLVADAGLGVINAVRGAIAAFDLTRPVIVMLNRFDENNPLHVANRDWLVHVDHLTVVDGVSEATTALSAL